MPRFVTITAIYGTAPTFPSGHLLPAGSTLADTAGNALAGDFVFPSFTAAPSKLNVAPLDASASAAMGGAPIVTLAQLVTQNLCGGAGTVGAAGQ
jgi:hypothetical protein